MDSQTNKLKPKQKAPEKKEEKKIMQINNKYIFYQKRERERE